jgi:hypothetical protein
MGGPSREAIMRACFIGVLAVLAAAPAMGDTVEPGKEGPLADILAPEPGARVCFRRIYDAQHLKAHPKQTVAEIGFRLAYHRFEPDENYPEGQRNYYFHLEAKRHGEARPATGGGECSAYEGRIFCGVDCDGGGLYLKGGGGGSSITLSFGDVWGIRMAGGCGGGEEGDGGADLLPGEDDKSFRLEKVDACPAYDDW